MINRGQPRLARGQPRMITRGQPRLARGQPRMINLRGQPRRNLFSGQPPDTRGGSTYVQLTVYLKSTSSAPCNERSSTYIQLTTCFYVSELGRVFK